MPKQQISDLLAQLQNDEAYTRNDAIKIIIKEKVDNEQIIIALKNVMENDPSMAVRNFACSALDVLGIECSAGEEPTVANTNISDAEITQTNNETTDSKKFKAKSFSLASVQFLLGFFGWLLFCTWFNTRIIWLYLGETGYGFTFYLALIINQLVGIGLSLLAFRYHVRWVGIGGLCGVGLFLLGAVTKGCAPPPLLLPFPLPQFLSKCFY